MPTLNLKHLRYFWTVAKHGSIARAAEVLHLTPQTISGQLSGDATNTCKALRYTSLRICG